MTSTQPVNLTDLPVELLSQIYSHLCTARTVSSLSLTCKALHRFTREEGWKAFTNARFASFKVQEGLKDYGQAAHGLTTLSRNWDRKSFLARYIEPRGRIYDGASGLATGLWRRRTGQTMGYIPFIDSYEELTGPEWGSRRQVVAWSAGADLLMRVQLTGKDAKDMYEESDARTREADFDSQRQWREWFTWRPPESAEGRDDITTVNLIKPPYFQDEADRAERILVGTASGTLSLIRAPVKLRRPFTKTTFDTGNLRVRSADVSPAPSELIASCLSRSDISLFPLDRVAHSTVPIKPLDQLSISTDKAQCQVRSTKFLSGNRIAVSLGPTSEPIQVYEITPHGLSREPIRKMKPTSGDWSPNERQDENTLASGFSTSVYPILPLSDDSSASSSRGNVFFSGCYFGAIRLHDLRSPRIFEMAFWDTGDSAVYSIQSVARERLVAAYSRYSAMRIFDVRVPDGRCYSYADNPRFGTSQTEVHYDASQTRCGFHRNPDSYNLFLATQSSSTGVTSFSASRHNRWRSQRTSSSPVYSISSPSSTSPTIFAGLENNVIQIDIASCSDPYPDTIFLNTIRNRNRGSRHDIGEAWNRTRSVINLALYESSKSQEGRKRPTSTPHRLLKQVEVGSVGGSIVGLDERWIDAKDF